MLAWGSNAGKSEVQEASSSSKQVQSLQFDLSCVSAITDGVGYFAKQPVGGVNLGLETCRGDALFWGEIGAAER